MGTHASHSSFLLSLAITQHTKGRAINAISTIPRIIAVKIPMAISINNGMNRVYSLISPFQRTISVGIVAEYRS